MRGHDNALIIAAQTSPGGVVGTHPCLFRPLADPPLRRDSRTSGSDSNHPFPRTSDLLRLHDSFPDGERDGFSRNASWKLLGCDIPKYRSFHLGTW